MNGAYNFKLYKGYLPIQSTFSGTIEYPLYKSLTMYHMPFSSPYRTQSLTSNACSLNLSRKFNGVLICESMQSTTNEKFYQPKKKKNKKINKPKTNISFP